MMGTKRALKCLAMTAKTTGTTRESLHLLERRKTLYELSDADHLNGVGGDGATNTRISRFASCPNVPNSP